jgi:hypothetical protein
MSKGKQFWGPPTWDLIHIFPLYLRYNNVYVEWLYLLQKLLPCKLCRNNLKVKLDAYPPKSYIRDRSSAFKYSYFLHDLANKQISTSQKIAKASPTIQNAFSIYKKKLLTGTWEASMWRVVHSFAATLRYENSVLFKKFLSNIIILIPDTTLRELMITFLKNNSINPYLRTHHDIFFYTYMLHKYCDSYTNKTTPSFIQVKTSYFSALGQECAECKV